MRISFSQNFARRGMAVLALIALGLCFVSFLQDLYAYFLSSKLAPPTSARFNLSDGICQLDVDCEHNLSTWFSSSLLLLCSILLAVITSAKKKYGEPHLLYWGILSLIFALMSVSEALPISELLTGPLRDWLSTGGLFYFAWVIPGGIFVAVFGLVYLRFIFVGLDSKFRWLFVSAGLLYVSGGLGLEMIGGLQDELYGRSNLTYAALVTLEEFLEMLGAILFLYALMLYTNRLEGREYHGNR
jgi:hypothetical protein